DRAVRLLDKAGEPFREPVVSARLSAFAVHALLDHHPATLVADDEAVQIKLEAILDGGAVDLGYQPAGLRKRRPVKARALADADELRRSLRRVPAPPAAHMNAKLPPQGGEPTFERADHACGDARGVPVHAHDGAERLEPEGVGETAQELIAPVVM